MSPAPLGPSPGTALTRHDHGVLCSCPASCCRQEIGLSARPGRQASVKRGRWGVEHVRCVPLRLKKGEGEEDKKKEKKEEEGEEREEEGGEEDEGEEEGGGEGGGGAEEEE